MPYCLKCGYEYLPGVERCPDCGSRLVATAPEPTKEAFVKVYDAPDEITAISVKAALEDVGIPAVEHVQRTWAYDGIDLSLRGIYSSFLVPESRAEQARKLIEEHVRALQAGEMAIEEDPAENSDD